MTVPAALAACCSILMTDFKPVMIVPIYMHGSAFARMLPGLLPFGLPLIVVDDGSDSDNAAVDG